MFGYTRYKQRHGEDYIVEQAKVSERFFSMLFDEYSDRIYAYFMHHNLQKQDAYDLTSLTFMTIAEKIEHATIQPNGFIYRSLRIARNHLCNFYRTSQSKVEVTADESIENEIVTNFLEPMDIVDYEYRLNFLHLGTQSFGKQEQQVYDLKYNQGLSNKEIAIQLGQSETTISSTLTKLKNKLKNKLEKFI